jgi:hypothetical protein
MATADGELLRGFCKDCRYAERSRLHALLGIWDHARCTHYSAVMRPASQTTNVVDGKVTIEQARRRYCEHHREDKHSYCGPAGKFWEKRS